MGTEVAVGTTTNKRPIMLEDSYEVCRKLNKEHGTTYYASTLVLPKIKQHHVHALYGFARYADEIVDAFDDAAVEQRAAALAQFGDQFFADLAVGRSDHEVLKAVIHTVKAFDLNPEVFQRFLRSMTMDLTVTHYETYADLEVYMDGSAAVIGEMMLPILEPLAPEAFGHARDLGNAFQLTNFLRDVNEDLDRGRVYLPQEDLRKFGVHIESRRVTPEWIELMRFEFARCYELYASADKGIALLPDRSARCITSARVLYARILDEIEANGFDVFSQRARVPGWKKMGLVAKAMAPDRLRRG
jgi:15-cis-phytoene synthase